MEERFVASVGNEKNPIHIKELKNRGKTYIDIRKMYTEDGEIKPTRKGIAILDEDLADVMTELIQFLTVDEKEALIEQLNEELEDVDCIDFSDDGYDEDFDEEGDDIEDDEEDIEEED